MDPADHRTLYAGTHYDAHLYKTTDGGKSWVATGLGLPFGIVEDIAIDPSNPQNLFAADNGGIFRSTDAGGSWALAGDVPAGPFRAVAIGSLAPLTVYGASCSEGCGNVGSGGVYRSADGGATWIQVNRGLVATDIYAVGADPTMPGTVYAGLGTDIAKTTDSARHWAYTPAGYGTWGTVVVDPTAPLTVYAGSGFVRKSIDGGASWSTTSNGLPPGATLALAIDPSSPSTIYAGETGWGVFETTDGADTWVARRTGLPVNCVVVALAIDPSTPTTLFAGTGIDGLFKSTNGGGSWQRVTLNGVGSIHGLAVDPVSSSTVFAAGEGGIYRSQDGGATWVNVVPTAFGYAVAIDPANPSVVMASLVEDGVYLSTDGGTTWRPLNRGLFDPTEVVALAWDASGSRAYATSRGGVWTIDLGQ